MPQVIKKQYYPGDLARRHAERSAKILNRTDAVKTPPPVSNDNALKVGDTTPDGMLCVKIDAKNNKALLRSDFTGDIDYETARKQAEGSVNGNPAGACRLPGMDELTLISDQLPVSQRYKLRTAWSNEMRGFAGAAKRLSLSNGTASLVDMKEKNPACFVRWLGL